MTVETPKRNEQEGVTRNDSRSQKRIPQIPRNPNKRPTKINMERSNAYMRAEHREVIRRAMQ